MGSEGRLAHRERTKVAGWLTGILLVLAPGSGLASEEKACEDTWRRRGEGALAEILAQVDASDPDVRMRARRAAKVIARDYYRARTPDGMRLVPGRIEVNVDGLATVGGFYLGRREVTVGEFLPFARASGLKTGRWEDLDPALPVTRVNLSEARAYAAKQGARLPTCGELEAAATARGHWRYPWGVRFDARRVNSREAGLGRAEPCGRRRGGCSIHGIADLLGNVAEWTDSAVGEGERQRFLAVGGSYRRRVRLARFVSYKLRPVARQEDVGFRLARSLPPPPAAEPPRKRGLTAGGASARLPAGR